MRFASVAVLAVALGLAACATPTTRSPAFSNDAIAQQSQEQQVAALKRLVEDDNRVQRVVYRFISHNVDLCGPNVAAATGFRVWNLALFEDKLRPAAATAFALDDRVTVSFVAADSGATAAGLLPGDRIVGLNGIATPTGKDAIEKFATMLDKAVKTGGPLTVKIDRAGIVSDVSLTPQRACNFQGQLALDDSLNAAADGNNIYITRGMLRFAKTDEELAIIVGHELAHNVMSHHDAAETNAALSMGAGIFLDAMISAATGGGPTRFAPLGSEFEREADYVGLYLMRRAGYDITGASAIWRRMAEEYPETLAETYTHPASPQRFLSLDATENEIRAKEASGEPLVPNAAE